MKRLAKKELESIMPPNVWRYWRVKWINPRGNRKDTYSLLLQPRGEWNYEIVLYNKREIQRFGRVWQDYNLSTKAETLRKELGIEKALLINAYLEGLSYQTNKKRKITDVDNRKVKIREYLGTPTPQIIKAYREGIPWKNCRCSKVILSDGHFIRYKKG